MAELLTSQYAPRQRLPSAEAASRGRHTQLGKGRVLPRGSADAEVGWAGSTASRRLFCCAVLGQHGLRTRFCHRAGCRGEATGRTDPVPFCRWWLPISNTVQDEVMRRNLGNVVMHGYVPKEQTPVRHGCRRLRTDHAAGRDSRRHESEQATRQSRNVAAGTLRRPGKRATSTMRSRDSSAVRAYDITTSTRSSTSYKR